MNNISQNSRYRPHQLVTRTKAVSTYRSSGSIDYVCRLYHISKASLMRWNAKYDGSRESLMDKSHRPNTPHPNSHTDEEIKWIRDYHRANPHISICELYGKLVRDKGYTRNPGSLYRVFVRLGFRKHAESTKKKSKHNHPYDTPKDIGIKWQMDVKYVPTVCYSGSDEQKFFQYTMIDEASRERFIYPYLEQTGYSTQDFVIRSIKYFGYAPEIIQTDNGQEFTYALLNTKRVHILDKLLNYLHIKHQLIRPRTPWHNGKVERSHRNDQERFYNFLSFYSYDDLKVQMQRYLNRSNRIPMRILGWKTPLEKRYQLEHLIPD